MKLALINAVGWSADVKRLSTFNDYMEYCLNHFPKERSDPSGIVTWEDILNNASPSQWAVMIYLYAMSDSNMSNMMMANSLLEMASPKQVSSESFMLPVCHYRFLDRLGVIPS